jgi:branched-chain amino acid transport system ATP-binding protein
MTTPSLILDDVSFSIGGAQLIQHVSFSLNPGDRVALMGPNGAGKTTLMHLVSGLYRPDSGRIVLGGEEVSGWSAHRRARHGLARTFQITNLFPTRTVEEHIALAVGVGHRQRGNPVRSWRRMSDVWEATDALIQKAGLQAIGHLPVAGLPYGDQRKLEIVVAVAHPAKVVLLDEPGAGLTVTEAESLIELVFGLSDDLAVLFVDHDVDLVHRLSNRMVLLDLGQVLATGRPSEVVASEAFASIYMGGDSRA